MNKKVMVISKKETFTVKGLSVKLQGIGIDSVYVGTEIASIKAQKEQTDILVFYMDETVETIPKVLVYLKDICNDGSKKLILIGSSSEYDTVLKFIPQELILQWFSRPLDMDAFLRKIAEYMDEASQEARKKCILIVDDDVTYMEIISNWLKNKYRVSIANSGIQAITWLAKNKADLILLDYEMPVTPGPQVLQMLKSEANTSTIPVMFLTGKGDRSSVQKVLDLKPVDYLLKSIDKRELLQKLDGFFKKREIHQ